MKKRTTVADKKKLDEVIVIGTSSCRCCCHRSKLNTQSRSESK